MRLLPRSKGWSLPGEATCRTPEDFKAWSQNLRHEEVMTTFYSYGQVGTRRQGEIIQGLGGVRQAQQPDPEAFARAVAHHLRGAGKGL